MEERGFVGDISTIVDGENPVVRLEHRHCHNSFTRLPLALEQGFPQEGEHRDDADAEKNQ